MRFFIIFIYFFIMLSMQRDHGRCISGGLPNSVFFGCWSEQIIELSGGIFQQTMFDCQRVKSAKDGRKVKIQDLPETFPDDRA